MARQGQLLLQVHSSRSVAAAPVEEDRRPSLVAANALHSGAAQRIARFARKGQAMAEAVPHEEAPTAAGAALGTRAPSAAASVPVTAPVAAHVSRASALVALARSVSSSRAMGLGADAISGIVMLVLFSIVVLFLLWGGTQKQDGEDPQGSLAHTGQQAFHEPPATAPRFPQRRLGNIPRLDLTPPAAPRNQAQRRLGDIPRLDLAPPAAPRNPAEHRLGDIPRLDVTPPAAPRSQDPWAAAKRTRMAPCC